MNYGVCPIPIERYPIVTLAHGGGGRLMHQLIDKMFVAALTNPYLEQRGDGARLPAFGGDWVVSTDGFVVHPLEFPGGNIGSLAVHGTVNDVAMNGAIPRYLSASWILEEGLPMERLWHLVASMGATARACNVQVVTGDTKVVERGKGDGVFISTTGFGQMATDQVIGPAQVREGDVVIVSGDIGRHGIAVMAARQDLGIATDLESDAGSLLGHVAGLLGKGLVPHCMRDLTRGGLAAAMHEIAGVADLTVELDETSIPIVAAVRGASEILGLDPMFVACEGRFVCLVPPALHTPVMQSLAETGAAPAVIGRVVQRDVVPVVLRTALGVKRPVDLPAGEQLPRIC